MATPRFAGSGQQGDYVHFLTQPFTEPQKSLTNLDKLLASTVAELLSLSLRITCGPFKYEE